MVRVVPSVSISCTVLLVVDWDRNAPAKVCLIAIGLVSAIVVHSQLRYHHVEVGPIRFPTLMDPEYTLQTLAPSSRTNFMFSPRSTGCGLDFLRWEYARHGL
jgi:hypothetical protein